MNMVSIIIAMYNIEDYIVHCINSCLHQENCSPSDYEIVIVNDGSTDNSLIYAQQAIAGHDNCRIITKPNGGLSSARNAGLDNIKGKYVWFVDGDDAIAPNAISIIISNIKKTQCDAYIHNFSTFNKKNIIETSSFSSYEKNYPGAYIHNTYRRNLPLMAWLTIYKADLLKQYNLRFVEGIIFEDKEFSVRAHHLSKSISIVPESLYFYRVERGDSIISTVKKDNTKALESQIIICNSFKDFFFKEKTKYARWLIAVNATAFYSLRYNDSFNLNETTKRLLEKNKFTLYLDMLKSRDIKRIGLLMFIILMPESIIKSFFKHRQNSAKLM